MNIGSGTYTRTVVDVRKVLNKFGADYSMIAQSTGLRTREDVESSVEDLILFADAGYLIALVLILWDAAGQKIKGRRYNVSNSALGWTSDDPGNNLWPKTPGGRLQLIAILSDAWWKFDDDAKQSEKQRLGVAGSWSHTPTDTSFTGMSAIRDKQYASNGFGMERWTYE